MTDKELFFRRVLELGLTRQTVTMPDPPWETAHLVDLSVVPWEDAFLTAVGAPNYTGSIGAIIFRAYPDKYGAQFYSDPHILQNDWMEILQDAGDVKGAHVSPRATLTH